MAAASCLNIASHLDPRFGGIVTSLPPMCEALEAQGRYRSPLAAFCLPDEVVPTGSRSYRMLRLPSGRLRWMTDSALRIDFASLSEESDVFHIHGVWDAHCAVASGFARRFRRPYLISAHGMLDTWALGQRRFKKRIYSHLVEFRNLSGAACMRAMTQNEAVQYRRFGLRNPIAIIPNGVEIPEQRTPDLIVEHHPALRGKQIVLFLGRIHTKKGLFPLCQAWPTVSKRFPDAHLLVGGPDFEGIESQLRQIIDDGGARSTVTFAGPLAGDLKWSGYAAATLFILPSFSEGFSVAILEALGSGKPVIITESCYFPEVIKAGAGWITNPTGPEIADALITALGLPASTLQAAGQHGAGLVRDRYTWRQVASQFGDVYDWIRGGSVPASVPVLAAGE